MTERKTYRGGCQCGAVAFEAEIALGEVAACNCSRCRRLGTLLAFVPTGDFRLVSGEGHMKEYLFNRHSIHHLFCAECGIQPFARATAPNGQDVVAINARCLDGVDAWALPVKHIDGASF